MIGVTGSTGFVGKALCERLGEELSLRRLVRKPVRGDPEAFVAGDIGPSTEWSDALRGLKCVVHCAAHVHQMGGSGGAELSDYRRVNTAGTLRLAEAAAKANVQRLVYLSSVKAMAEFTPTHLALQHCDAPAPLDPYGISKWEAEQGLWEIARQTGLEVVVVRPPLVYGPGVGANFRQLMHWVGRGIPLPVAAIRNQRSLVALPNLVDLISTCITHPAAPGNTFLVSDGQDLSTPELICALAEAMERRPRIFSVPVEWLELLGNLTGRSSQVQRLTQSLQVDIGHTREVLGWEPVCSVDQGLRQAVEDFWRS